MNRDTILKILCVTVMLQPFGFPLLISGHAQDVSIPDYLLWGYPAFALLAGICAWKCVGSRSELAIIIIILAWMSFAGLCYMTGVF